MLNEPQYAIPWAVACVFRDEATGNVQSRLDLIFAYGEGHACAVAVSEYHRAGGAYPLFTIQCAPVSEAMCRTTVQVYDDIAALKKAETEKTEQRVVSLVPPIPVDIDGIQTGIYGTTPPDGAA
jgi:hypothetical protein